MDLKAEARTLSEKRRGLVKRGRDILEKPRAEKRDMSGEETSEYEKVMAEVDALKDQIDKLEKQIGAEEDSERDETVSDEEREGDEEEEREGDEEEDKKKDDEGERSVIRLPDGRIARLVKPGKANRSRPGKNTATVERWPSEPEHEYRNRVRRNSPEYKAAYVSYLINGPSALSGKHARAIQADSDIVGGYLVAPQEFVGELIKFVDNLLFIRQKATKYTVASAQSLGAPSLDTDPADSDWTSELATGNEDTAMAFGKRELYPHPLAKRIKVSNKLLRAATITSSFSQYNAAPVGNGAEGLVRGRLAYKFAVSEEKAFMTGNGAQQPLGLFVASARGISTGRDVNTGLATGFTADGLFDAFFSLKQQYQQEAEWLFHRDAVKQIRKLKDGMGQYLWQPGLAGTKPDTLLDRPLNMSEYVPNTYTSGLYVGLLGVLRYYWIADAIGMQIQRLVELYAEANQVGFIARMELDGMPVLEEAFARLKTN